MHTGKVKYWNADRGFGILTRSDGAEVFAHISAVVNEQLESLSVGAAVQFKTQESKRKPGHSEAVDVVLVETEGNAQ